MLSACVLWLQKCRLLFVSLIPKIKTPIPNSLPELSSLGRNERRHQRERVRERLHEQNKKKSHFFVSFPIQRKIPFLLPSVANKIHLSPLQKAIALSVKGARKHRNPSIS